MEVPRSEDPGQSTLIASFSEYTAKSNADIKRSTPRNLSTNPNTNNLHGAGVAYLWDEDIDEYNYTVRPRNDMPERILPTTNNYFVSKRSTAVQHERSTNEKERTNTRIEAAHGEPLPRETQCTRELSDLAISASQHAGVQNVLNNGHLSCTNDVTVALASLALEDGLDNNTLLQGIGSWTSPAHLTLQSYEDISSQPASHSDLASLPDDTARDSNDFSSPISTCAREASSVGNRGLGNTVQSSQRDATDAKRTTNRPRHNGKRKKVDADDNEDEEEEDDGKHNQDLNTEKENHLFVCPFSKRYPQENELRNEGNKYRTCLTTKFPNMSRVKDHLYKVHKQPIMCCRCQQIFKDEASKTAHLKKDNMCSMVEEDTTRLFITSEQKEVLRKKPRGSGPCEQWSGVWGTLFPDAQVQSPTRDERSRPADLNRTAIDALSGAISIPQLLAQLRPKLGTEIFHFGLPFGVYEWQANKLLARFMLIIEHEVTQILKNQPSPPAHFQSGQIPDIDGYAHAAGITEYQYSEALCGTQGLIKDHVTPVQSTFPRNSTGGTSNQVPPTPADALIYPGLQVYGIYNPDSDSGYGSTCGDKLCGKCSACEELLSLPHTDKMLSQVSMLPTSIALAGVTDASTLENTRSTFGGALLSPTPYGYTPQLYESNLANNTVFPWQYDNNFGSSG